MRTVVSYGGGTNSMAMLLGLHERGERPDAIVFADTGGEKPQTYGHMWDVMQPWCERVGFPSITIVRGSQPMQRRDGSLEAECLRRGALPAKAYGYSTCSHKWKIDPYMKWQREWATPQTTVVKLIGFHAGESERVAGAPEADQLLRRYPLIEWAWDYEDCIAAIERAGMPLPGKSACFFCPSSKAHEIIALPKDLLARALEMERRAMSGEVGEASRCGLGRYFTWRDLIRDHEAQPDLFTITPEECSTEGCFT